MLKRGEQKYKPFSGQIATGDAMAELMGIGQNSKRMAVASGTGDGASETSQVATSNAEKRVTSVLTHPPRPRKKRR